MTDRAADRTDTTTRLDQDVVERVSLAKDSPPSPRDEQTVRITRSDGDTVRVDREVPAPRSGAGRPAAAPPSPWGPTPPPPPYPPAGPPAGPPGGPPMGGWQPPPPPPWPGTQVMPAPVNPPLPPARGGSNIPLIVFGVLAALVITGGAWALIMLAAGSSPFGSSVADDPQAAPPTSAAPGPSAPAIPLPPSSAPGTGDPSSGPTGEVQVSWDLAGVTYLATVTTSGATGTATVAYTATGQPNEIYRIRQDLALSNSGGKWAYVGSNPVDADSAAPAANYAPDIFVLETNDAGEVSITEVCDTTGTCSPATME